MAKPRIKRVGVAGARGIKANLMEIARALSGEARTQLAYEVSEALGRAASVVTDQAKANASALGLDPKISQAVFVFAKPTTTRRRARNAALIGVSKGVGSPAYVEWRAGRGPGTTKSLDGSRDIVRKRDVGELVGMSSATMAELGTSNKMPTPFWIPAMKSKRKDVRAAMAAELSAVIEKYAPPPAKPEDE